MSGPAVQFVRVCLGDSYRVVTFYEDQPVHELKTLLGALFPGTTAANGQAPVAIERLMDGVVVPLSSATKCPQVMSEGSWELLVSRPNDLTTEKLILQGFLHDLFAHGIITSEQISALHELLNASDTSVMQSYRAFRQHLDVVQLKNDLLECATQRAEFAASAAATGVDNYSPRMIAFVEHFHRCGKLTAAQASILVALIERGSVPIMSAYTNAREKDDIDALYTGMVEIASFYLHQNGGGPQEQQQQQQQPREFLERPATPTPYNNEDGTMDEDDILEMFEDLVDGNFIPVDAVDGLRNILLSNNPYVDAAVELYSVNHDVEDFVDTLMRIVRHQESTFTAQDAYDAQQAMMNVGQGESESESEYDDEYQDMELEEPEEEQEQTFEQESEQIEWSAIEGTTRLLDSLMSAGVFEFEDVKKLSMLLLSDYSSTQQEVLVAAYQLYEQDADAEEFVDTCKRVLKQLSALDQAHLEAFAGVVCADGRFSDYQQALLVTMWNGIEPRVMAAWDVFVYDRRESELVDTLSRIVSQEFEIEEEDEEERGAGQDTRRSSSPPAASHKRNFSELGEDDNNGVPESINSSDDSSTYFEVMRQVIELMTVEGIVDHDGGDTLLKLVLEGHTVVAAAYDAFSHDEDVDELMDTLQTVVEYVRNHHDDVNVKELLQFIQHTVQKDRMSPEDGAEVARLVEDRNPCIMAAYDLYYEDQNVEELLDTLQAAGRVIREEYVRQANDQLDQEGEDEEDESGASEEDIGQQDGGAANDARRVVELCYRRGELEEEDAAVLMASLSDPRLLAAVDNFAVDGDWNDLRDTLQRLSAHLIMWLEAEVDEGDGEEEEDEAEELEEQQEALANGYKYSYDTEAGTTDYTSGNTDEDEEWNDTTGNTGDTGNITEGREDGAVVDVGDLVIQLDLEPEEKLLIYDMLRQGDPMTNAAFEIYESDGDLEDLTDTLSQIVLARFPGGDTSDEEEEEEEEKEGGQGSESAGLYTSDIAERVFDALYTNGLIQNEEKERFIMLLNGGNIVANAALEVFGVDGDAQDFVDTMRRIQ